MWNQLRSDTSNFIYRCDPSLYLLNRNGSGGRESGVACVDIIRIRNDRDGLCSTFFAEPLLALLTAASLYLIFEEDDLGVVAVLAALAVLAKPPGVVLGSSCPCI